MMKHWIVVADAHVGRIYATDELVERLDLVEELKEHGHRVVHGSGGAPTHVPGAGRGAGQAHGDPHKLGEEKFARAVADALDEGARRHAYERMVLIAPPVFLGQVRAELAAQAKGRLVASVHHDWTQLGLNDLRSRVKKELEGSQRVPG